MQEVHGKVDSGLVLCCIWTSYVKFTTKPHNFFAVIIGLSNAHEPFHEGQISLNDTKRDKSVTFRWERGSISYDTWTVDVAFSRAVILLIC